MIAVAGPRMDNLFVGIREFSTKKAILLSSEKNMDLAEKTKKDLGKFKILAEIKEIKGGTWEGIFKAISEIKKIEKEENLVINTATGDVGGSGCAICSAAFVNGIKAFSVADNKVIMLPILKFNYYDVIGDKKRDVLKEINKPNCCASLEDLSKKTGMSLPLVSYHVNGTLKSPGLKELGLVETKEVKGRIEIHLTTLGRLVLEGYVK